MLVTLANNQAIAANATGTFTYSPNSVQKVFINVEDEHWEQALVTVQIGSTTICNGIEMFGLMGLTQLQSGTTQNVASAEGGMVVLDFGNHECETQDNLYVSVQAANALDYTDVSAIVDTPGQAGPPLKLTAYSYNTFTSSNNLSAISYDSAHAVVDEDAYNVEIRTSISSSAPSFISASSWYQSQYQGGGYYNYFGLLNIHGVPLSTTYNYSSSAITDTIITVEQMGQSARQIASAKRSGRLALSQAGK